MKDFKDIIVRCIKSEYNEDFTVGILYKMTSKGIKDNTSYLWDDFLSGDGENLLDKWHKEDGHFIKFEEVIENPVNINTEKVVQLTSEDDLNAFLAIDCHDINFEVAETFPIFLIQYNKETVTIDVGSRNWSAIEGACILSNLSKLKLLFVEKSDTYVTLTFQY